VYIAVHVFIFLYFYVLYVFSPVVFTPSFLSQFSVLLSHFILLVGNASREDRTVLESAVPVGLQMPPDPQGNLFKS